MNCKISKSQISGIVKCPANKSYTHRAIFLASLAGDESKVENVLFSADTNATIKACIDFGAEIEKDESSIIVKNKIKFNKTVPEINTENSGTTIRIASAIASLFDHEITLTGDESLQKRPMQPLLNALTDLGAECTSTNGNPPVKIKGKINGGSVTIPGNFSSQFISALLISGPLTENGINLNIEGNLVSKPYLDATISSMRNYGVSVQTLIPYKKYNIIPQIYQKNDFSVPIDFSSLALLLAANVLVGKDMIIQGDIGHLPQGDEVFLDILSELGVKIKIENEQIEISTPEKLKGGKFDLSNSPDLLPPLSILILKSENPIEIFNVKHARLKETDRIAIISRELQKIGIQVDEKEDGMVLRNSNTHHGAKMNSENDHRLFMAFSIAGMFVGDCIVSDPNSINVSFPNFIAVSYTHLRAHETV
ncbi:MAG: 3-phosphoshikimate 1-carboxyvinyltransferase, partial [Nitrosopumilus sp.]